MAAQSFVEQHIIFISPSHVFTEDDILGHSLIQTLASNAVANALITTFQGYKQWDGTNWTHSTFFEIVCYVTSAFQTVIQNNMANIKAAFPEYTVATWGFPVSFGS